MNVQKQINKLNKLHQEINVLKKEINKHMDINASFNSQTVEFLEVNLRDLIREYVALKQRVGAYITIKA